MASEGGTGRTLATLAAAYGAWIATCILGVGVTITWHGALLRLYMILRFNKYGTAFFNDLLVLGLVGLWLALIVLAEGGYRRAADRGTLLAFTWRTLVALVALWLLGYVVGRL